MKMETPQISGYASTNTVYPLGAVGIGNVAQGGALDGLYGNQQLFASYQANQMQGMTTPTNKKGKVMVSRRLVQVFIADPDDNVPLDQCILYSGVQKLTDATDQELFFEVDIKSALQTHNEKRAKLINKNVKERTEYLEPAKVRDLKMVVVTVAQF